MATHESPGSSRTGDGEKSTLLKNELKTRTASGKACFACRQMKMKCDATEYPCPRCRKANRECVPQPPRVKSSTNTPNTYPGFVQVPVQKDNISPPNYPAFGTSQISNTTPYAPPQAALLPRLIPRAYPHNHSGAVSGSLLEGLPSIYSTAPVDAVVGDVPQTIQSPPSSKSIHLLPGSRKRKYPSGLSPGKDFPTPSNSSQYDETTPLSRQDIRDMIQLFCERHLCFIPVLYMEDFRDIERLIDEEPPFVQCVCYVTARYLHGGKEIRESLLPEVAKIPKELFSHSRGGRPLDQMITLKALIVLYSYADLTPPTEHNTEAAGKEDILYWPLKSLIEVYGLRLTLHRVTGISPIYLLAMALTMAHYSSIISGTPPSIRIDSSIRAVPQLAEQLGSRSRLSNLFGEVELYMIWEQASSQHPALGEWWYFPDSSETLDENAIEAVLKEADRKIDEWYNKWWSYMNESHHGPFLDYHGRFTRFCITSYGMKSLRTSPQDLSPLQKDQIRRCVTCASHVLDWPLSRGPIMKDRLRYVADSACIMISFCCVFIQSACRAFTSMIPNINQYLNNVEEAAQLMVDYAINSEHKPHIQGSFILKRAATLRAFLENPEAQGICESEARREDVSLNNGWTFDGSWLNLNEDGFFGMEPFYDFSMLLPSAQEL